MPRLEIVQQRVYDYTGQGVSGHEAAEAQGHIGQYSKMTTLLIISLIISTQGLKRRKPPDHAGRSVDPIARGSETKGDGKNMQSAKALSESPEGQKHPSEPQAPQCHW